MSGRADTERILDAFLAPDTDRLPDRVIDAALDEIALDAACCVEDSFHARPPAQPMTGPSIG
jgi:hypothetical protein